MPSVDSLSIQITASATSAQKKVDELVKSLNNLAGAINRLDTSKFETLSASANSLSQGLSGLKGSNVKNIEKVAKALQNVSSEKDAFEPIAQGAEQVAEQTKGVSSSLEGVKTDFNEIDGQAFEKVAESANKASESVGKTSENMSGFKSALSKLRIIIPTDDLDKVNKKIASLTEKAEELKDRLNYKKDTQAGYVDSKEMEKDQAKIEGLISEIDRLKLKQKELESHGGFKFNFESVENVSKALSNVNSKLKSFTSHLRKAHSETKANTKATKQFDISTTSLVKSLTRAERMLRLMILRKALRAVLEEIGNGFKSLALHSEEFDNSMSNLINSSKKLGYSFAAMVSPLINALAPALQYVINLLTKLANIINQIFSLLTGHTTYNKARDFAGKWSDDIAAANKGAKELKKTVLGFDELNQLQDNNDSSSGGGGSNNDIVDMFDTVPIEKKWKDFLDKLLAPIKTAWAKIGDEVKKAWKKALDNCKKLWSDVVRDFWKVWEQAETEKIFENIFKIIRDIGNFIGNIAKQLDKAWNKNEVGLHILEKIRDIIGIIVAGIQRVTESWAEWADTIDFYPLLESIDNLLEALKKPAEALMGIFEDLNKDFIQPLATWLIETGLPKLGDAFTEFVNAVDWDLMRERLDRVWKALEPFAQTIGEGLIIFIEKVGNSLAGFLNSPGWDSFIDTLVTWMNKIDAEKIAKGLERIFEALAAYKTADAVSTIADKLKEIGGWGTIKVFIKIAVAFQIGQWAFDLVAKFWEWLIKVGMEQGGYTQMQIDITLAWFQKFNQEYGGIGGLGHLIMDFITGDTDRKSSQWDIEAKVETMGITEAEVQVEDLRSGLESIDNTSFDSVKNNVQDFGKSVGELAINVQKDTDSISKSTDKIKFKPLSDETSNFSKNASKAFSDFKTNVDKDSSSIKESLGGVNDTIEETTTVVSDDFETITTTVSSGADEILDMSDTIKDSFSKDKWTFQGVADGLGETFRRAKEAIKKEWNEIANTLNGNHQVGSNSMKIDLPKFYATGGFPEDGWFRASHGEMLGRFDNGQSVVANNNQITDGIAKAVYSAMISANGGNSGDRPIYTTIQVDGRTIARAVSQGMEQNNRRYSPTMA